MVNALEISDSTVSKAPTPPLLSLVVRCVALLAMIFAALWILVSSTLLAFASSDAGRSCVAPILNSPLDPTVPAPEPGVDPHP